MDFGNWLLYAVAALGLSLTPGPNGLLALTHGALFGVRKTLATIFGGITGFFLVIAMSMFGIGALLATSASLLIALKWMGGAYLVFLGIQVWRSPALSVSRTKVSAKAAQLYRAGLFSALSNPKGILFFVAFLPQFIDPERSLVVQFAIMASTFLVIELLYEIMVAALADRITPWLGRVGKNFNRTFGAVFVAIGVLLPLRG